jgi:hypothetical protein
MEMIRAEDTRSLLATAHREDLHLIDPDNFAGVGSLFLVSSFKRCFESNKAIAQNILRKNNLMNQRANLVPSKLKTPRAAAIAGIVFSVLMISGLLLIRLSVRASPLEEGTWLRTSSGAVAHSLYLVPFAGIAFLWFIGVLRDRLGEIEDRFVGTVFFGSGLLFLAMIFTSAAVTLGVTQ